ADRRTNVGSAAAEKREELIVTQIPQQEQALPLVRRPVTYKAAHLGDLLGWKPAPDESGKSIVQPKFLHRLTQNREPVLSTKGNVTEKDRIMIRQKGFYLPGQGYPLKLQVLGRKCRNGSNPLWTHAILLNYLFHRHTVARNSPGQPEE